MDGNVQVAEASSKYQLPQNQKSTVREEPINQPQEKKQTNFLSSDANLEYSTLSSLLHENIRGFNPNLLATLTEGTPNAMVVSPTLSPTGYGISKHSPSTLAAANYPAAETTSTNPTNPQGDAALMQFMASDFPVYDPKINQFLLGSIPDLLNLLFPRVVEVIMKSEGNNPFQPVHPHLHPSFTIRVTQNELESTRNNRLQFKEPEEINAEITKPFLYTPGFHRLIAYLRGRFSKDKLVKMAESMAVYRPSFIACINSLRKNDLIFMEQCFQRTLISYDSFIRISGTPTIVWRRTGEIAYVANEFTILTGWTHEQLMCTFIVELLDDQFVVVYFQLLSKIAFDDLLGATMTECTLLTPNKDVKIRTGCMWTLKRDVFGIAMMIIGNFLPIV